MMSKEFVKERLPPQYYRMVGADDLHYYVAYPRSGGRVEIHFLQLPLHYTLSYEGYVAELERLVETYLMLQHDSMTDEQKKEFGDSLRVKDGKIGMHEVQSPTLIEIGFLKLNVQTSITRDGGSVTDFRDILQGAP